MLPDPRPFFISLVDPRRETKNKLHVLGEIIFIVLSAVLSGIEDWVGIQEFAEIKEEWLRKYLSLPNGIPSHDTLSDVMGRLSPKLFNACFLNWVEAALPSLAGEHIAIDGKTLRGSSQHGCGAIHLVSAFACHARLVLAQQAVDGKSNEITAIPDLLSLLDLERATVSLDAMGCQKEIAQQIIEAHADYVLAVKENHPKLHKQIQQHLDSLDHDDDGGLTQKETIDLGRRTEIRRYILSDQIENLSQKGAWAGLAAVGMVESIRDVQGAVSVERRYFVTSLTDLERFAAAVRTHWGIENSEHWVLDVQFGEDRNRAGKDHSAENLALIRRMSLNLLRQNAKDKKSLRLRKTRAALDDRYREELLFGGSVT
jgi:predicted transposase YbfD/YdcC